jgi:hypothetical protein
MLFHIWDTAISQDKIYVRLVQEPLGPIKLVACSEDGQTLPGGALLSIWQDGIIHRTSGVSPYLGFYLEKGGKVIIT